MIHSSLADLRHPHRALEAVGLARSPRTREAVAVATGLGILGAVVVARLTGAVSLHLTPDAGHALADADALLGEGVRPMGYMPAFPALVALTRALSGDAVTGVHLALGLVFFALGAGLYVLIRQFAPARAAFAGAGVGMTTPVIAEALGWSGGATILATASVAAALACLERWICRPHRTMALATGAFLGLALASHLFVPVVGAALVGVRWLAELARQRTITLRGAGPLALEGMAIAAIPVVIGGTLVVARLADVAAPSGTSLGMPDPSATSSVLSWATRESPVLLLVVLGALASMLVARSGARWIGLGCAAVVLVLPAVMHADPSYQTRVAYFLPLVVGLGTGLIIAALDARLSRPAWPSLPGRLTVLMLPAILIWTSASLGFDERLVAAARFYQRIDASDLSVMQRLRETPGGTVATSWPGNAYGDGLPVSWLVEGLARRKAAGPVDPVLSTDPGQIAAGAAMQRLFAGRTTMENGAIQLAYGPDDSRADPAVAANVAGFYHPILYLNSRVDAMAGGPPDSWTHIVTSSGVASRGVDAAGKTVIDGSSSLRGDTANVTQRSVAGAGPRTVWIWPAYGVDWQMVSNRGGTIGFQAVPVAGGFSGTAAATAVEIAVDGGEAIYHEREARYGLEAIEVRIMAEPLALHVRFPGLTGGEPRFDHEEAILVAEDVRQVLVWRDTGWLDRFERSTCFERASSSPNLVLYDVVPSCRR